MKKLIVLSIIFNFFILLLNSCTTNNSSLWYSKPLNISDYSKVDVDINYINSDKLKEAIILLNETKIIEINAEQFMYFTGNTSTSKQMIILCRSLYYAHTKNGFSIYYSSNKEDLWIRHGALTSSKQMYKYAFIILVDQLPKNVYITASAAK